MATSETIRRPSEAIVEAVREFARDTVQRWSDKCQQFLDAEGGMLRGEASPEQIAAHKVALRLLLTFGRSVYGTAASPDYPDRWIANELEGRLIQLEHIWRIIHERMPEPEAEALLRDVFPE